MKISLRTLILAMSAVCVYIGAYIQLSCPTIIVDERNLGMVIKGYREPSYKIENQFVAMLFKPAYCVDYAMRKEFWTDFHGDFHVDSTVSWESLTRRPPTTNPSDQTN